MHRIRNEAVRLLAAGSRCVSFRGQVRVVRALLPTSRVAGLTTIVELRDGRRFHVSADDYLEWYLLFFGSYEPEITRLLGLLIGKTSTVIDVGANIGVHSLTMAALAKDGRVVACEPHPITRERLRANLVLNRVENVEIFPVAVLDQESEVDLHDNMETNRAMASLHSYEGWIKTRVEGTTLDTLVTSAGISGVDVIKIDIEGYEAPALAGASTVLLRDRPSVIFEYVQWAWENCGFRLESTLRQLRDIGYEQFFLIGRSGLSVLPEPFVGSGNILVVGRSAARANDNLANLFAQQRAR